MPSHIKCQYTINCLSNSGPQSSQRSGDFPLFWFSHLDLSSIQINLLQSALVLTSVWTPAAPKIFAGWLWSSSTRETLMQFSQLSSHTLTLGQPIICCIFSIPKQPVWMCSIWTPISHGREVQPQSAHAQLHTRPSLSALPMIDPWTCSIIPAKDVNTHTREQA